VPHFPRSPDTVPRRSRPNHDRLVFGVTFGTLLGGTAGWLVATGFSPLGGTVADRSPLNSLSLEPPASEDFTANPVPGQAADSEVPPEGLVVPAPLVPDDPRPSHLQPTRAPRAFADLAEDYWAKPYIDALTAREVLSGLPDGTFAPDRPLSRAELAAQIAKAFTMTPQTASKSFNDLPSDYWATDPIQQAVAMGFMTGYPNSEFRPTQVVTRLQVLVALATGLSLPATTASQQQLQQYADWQAVPPWAREQVGAAIQAGIIRPQPNAESRLRPNDPATRAEVATLIYSALAYLGSVEAIAD